MYRNLIMCTMNAGIASNVVLRLEYTSSYNGIGAWQALCRKFERSTKSHRINDILRIFHSSNYSPHVDPKAYLHELEDMKTMAEHCGAQYTNIKA